MYLTDSVETKVIWRHFHQVFPCLTICSFQFTTFSMVWSLEAPERNSCRSLKTYNNLLSNFLLKIHVGVRRILCFRGQLCHTPVVVGEMQGSRQWSYQVANLLCLPASLGKTEFNWVCSKCRWSQSMGICSGSNRKWWEHRWKSIPRGCISRRGDAEGSVSL